METAQLGIEGGHGPGAVDAHQPVGLRSADGGVGQRAHFFVAAQRGETIPDGGGGHRLEPEPPNGLPGFSVLDDVAEDQFALAAGVTRIDQGIDILAFDQLGQELEAAFGLFDGPQVEVWWNDGQGAEGPFAFFHFKLFRNRQLQQMAHGRGEHILIALVKLVLLAETAQRLGNIAGDRRFLCND